MSISGNVASCLSLARNRANDSDVTCCYHTTNTVTIGGTFSVNTGTVTQNSQQANPCNPGACFDAITTVHANRGWQLQVTLNSTPANFTVRWISLPSNEGFPLTAGVWQTIETGTTATPSQQFSSEYNANKTTGPGGFVPTAAQVAAVLTYRVIAFPAVTGLARSETFRWRLAIRSTRSRPTYRSANRP